MWFFNLFKKKKNEISHEQISKNCLSTISSHISDKIDKVNWANFQTAYGNAEKTIPFYLKNLFCSDEKIAMDASHQLWCSLCHQHVFISDAAVPSYEILKIALSELNDELKIEILDIFTGFAYCSRPDYDYIIDIGMDKWKWELRQKMLEDIELYKDLSKNTNEDIAAFAIRICENLVNQEIND